jgi:DNA-binding LacI/PurR family transcriptional regulator
VSSINAIQDAGRAAGYSVAVAQLPDLGGTSISAGLDHLLGQSVEGIVVIAPQEVVLDRLQSARLGVPYVTLLGGPSTVQRELTVDQVSGARAATQHLIRLGHRRIVHLSGPLEWFEAEARVHGYRAELTDAGLLPEPVLEGDWTAESGYLLARRVLDDPGVTAVFASNDQMALGVYHAARERGLGIPEQVSVVGFDDIPEAAHFWPPLTTVLQDFTELGRRSVESLIAEIEGGAEPTAVSLQPELIVRSSTGRPVTG